MSLFLAGESETDAIQASRFAQTAYLIDTGPSAVLFIQPPADLLLWWQL
jgi:hypothetical protein